MPLQYPARWKFDTVGFSVPPDFVHATIELITHTAGNNQDILETFKDAFGGTTTSSSYGWAINDLRVLAAEKSNNAADFVDALWSGIEICDANYNVPVPRFQDLNRLLDQHNVSLVVDPPYLRNPNWIDVLDATTDASATGNVTMTRGYELHEQLGTGGYGVVYRASRTTDVATFQYALKILDPSPLSPISNVRGYVSGEKLRPCSNSNTGLSYQSSTPD